MFRVELFYPENGGSMFPWKSTDPLRDHGLTSEKTILENNFTCLFVSGSWNWNSSLLSDKCKWHCVLHEVDGSITGDKQLVVIRFSWPDGLTTADMSSRLLHISNKLSDTSFHLFFFKASPHLLCCSCIEVSCSWYSILRVYRTSECLELKESRRKRNICKGYNFCEFTFTNKTSPSQCRRTVYVEFIAETLKVTSVFIDIAKALHHYFWWTKLEWKDVQLKRSL
jgi:hypothetical protein